MPTGNSVRWQSDKPPYEYLIEGRWWTVKELAKHWQCHVNTAYGRALTRFKARRKRRVVVE